MTSTLKLLLNIACLCGISVAVNIHGTIKLPDENLLNSTRITLTGDNTRLGTYSTSTDGSFTFYDVQPGVHLLDVQSTTYMFSQVKIQVPEEYNTDEALKCIEYYYPGAPKIALDCSSSIQLYAHAKYDYFEPRPKFSIFGLFKNPMMLMMLVSGGLMLLMPKMMEGMDDEQREQMRKQMELQKDPTKLMSSLWSDISGASSQDEQRQKSPSKSGKKKRN